jgi:hypothetical protein
MNRNKLIAIFIANLSNAIVHDILEKSIDKQELRSHYDAEHSNFLKIAIKYREKTNPVNFPSPDKDIKHIVDRIKRNVTNELMLRISKGYKGINLSLVDEYINKELKKMKILE